MFTILRHVRSNRLRKQGRAPITVDVDDQLDSLPAVESTPQHLTDQEVLGALAALPAGYQEVVLLADVEEFTYKEIATMLEVPLGTVMSRLHRARRLLRAALVERAPHHGWRIVGRSQGRRRADMTCAQCLSMADAFLADELPVDTSQDVIAHVEGLRDVSGRTRGAPGASRTTPAGVRPKR